MWLKSVFATRPRSEALLFTLGSYLERGGRRYRVIEIRREPEARILLLCARDDSPAPGPASEADAARAPAEA